MDMPLLNEQPITNGPTVVLPNGSTTSATHEGLLNIPQLSNKAKLVHKFPHFKKSLLSLSTICDEGGTAIFSKHNMHILHNGRIILKGIRDTSTGLWFVPLNNVSKPCTTKACAKLAPKTNCALAVLETTRTKQELVRFLHACCFFPVTSTWINAIKNGNFATFPGLTADLVSKYLPQEVPAILGHKYRNKQGLQSTTAQAANAQLFPEPPVEEFYIKLLELPHLICTDQTGRFPIQLKSV